MKVYVDELPKSCNGCLFYKLDTYVDVYGHQTNSHECVLDGSMLINSCPLQTLADYTMQVRKEVCQEIREKMTHWEDCLTKEVTEYVIDKETLDKIEKGE